mmetsp:Transcript_41945/g.67470  ORF Transcript_41945/g.67470 Transcript_41945/m.67470 type:complete len:253 (+) Transcript_41945:149-907(+)
MRKMGAWAQQRMPAVATVFLFVAMTIVVNSFYFRPASYVMGSSLRAPHSRLQLLRVSPSFPLLSCNNIRRMSHHRISSKDIIVLPHHLALRRNNRKSSTTSNSMREGVQDDKSLPESSTPPPQQQSPEDQSNRKTIAIDTQTLRKSVRFQPANLQGKNIILIDAVRIGSSAEALGLKPGQRLLAISDPIQGPDVVWDIQDNTSLRFVMDAIRVTTSRTTVIAVQDPDPTQPAPRSLREGGYDAGRSFRIVSR